MGWATRFRIFFWKEDTNVWRLSEDGAATSLHFPTIVAANKEESTSDRQHILSLVTS